MAQTLVKMPEVLSFTSVKTCDLIKTKDGFRVSVTRRANEPIRETAMAAGEKLVKQMRNHNNVMVKDATNPEAWLGMADVYIRMGEYDKALEILRQSLDKTGNDESIAGKIAEMEAGTFADASGKTRKSCYYENGELLISCPCSLKVDSSVYSHVPSAI